MNEPRPKRTGALVDGKNLFHAAREAFGYTVPNYDVTALAGAVCAAQADWKLQHVRFYTGVPDADEDVHWHAFWSAKLGVMGRPGSSCLQPSAPIPQPQGRAS